jgi:hypothetical protein
LSDAPRPRVVDADGHVIEPPQLWGQYLEPRFRRRAPRPQRDENGKFGYVVDDVAELAVLVALWARRPPSKARLEILAPELGRLDHVAVGIDYPRARCIAQAPAPPRAGA